MKKNFNLLSLCLLLIASSLVGCNKENNTNSPIIISEVVEGKLNNRVIELYNNSDNTVNLDNYSIEIELYNSINTINLSGNLKTKETFIIAYSKACDELISKADIISSDLMFNGTQPIKLKNKNKIVDIIGEETFQNNYYQDISLVRKKEFLIPRKQFDEYDWIRYNCDNYSYLGTIDTSISNEELLDGPVLTDEFLKAPYFKTLDDGSIVGAGGVMEVEVSSYVDGDTTVFKCDPTINASMGLNSTMRVRYQNIDTPESYKGNVQEFGLVAKEFTLSQLAFADKIIMQSVLDGPITETFDRMLSWIWIDDKLLNMEIVKNGYSELAFSSVDTMLYKDVSYSNFLYNAQLYAKKMKKGKFGEVDPYWDYDLGQVKDNAPGINPEK